MDAGALLTAAGMVIAGVVWLVRLEGKIFAQSQLHEKLVDDVAYIRGRIDAAINGHLR
jgi:hypothetical protein